MAKIPADTTFLANPRFAKTRDLIQDLNDAVSRHAVQPRQRINTALDWMLRAHYHQADRSDGPYVNHPLAVALHVIEHLEQRDADLITAALLHDLIEDQAEAVLALADATAVANPVNMDAAVVAVSAHFGERVGTLVSCLTNPDFDALQSQHAANGQIVSRNQLYRDHVAAIFDHKTDAFVIKLADLWQNAGSLYAMPDLQQRARLQHKYEPVLAMIIERLVQLDDPQHPLHAPREKIVTALTAIHETLG